MSRPLVELTFYFLSISLISVGGVNGLLPEMHRALVEQHQWMSNTTFVDLFAIAQSAPGPNILVVSLFGMHIGGFFGALLATSALCVPTSFLSYHFSGFWLKVKNVRWRYAVEVGLAPLSVGLVLSSGWLLAKATIIHVPAGALTAASVLASLKFKANPLWWIVVGALFGIFGFI